MTASPSQVDITRLHSTKRDLKKELQWRTAGEKCKQQSKAELDGVECQWYVAYAAAAAAPGAMSS